MTRSPQPTKPPICHFDYDELEQQGHECDCYLCDQYREALDTYTHYLDVCRGHSRSCSCYLCTQKNKATITYLAALSKRDTYSELSFLTNHRPLGPQFLDWMYDRMTDNRFNSEAWWAIRAPMLMLQEWIERFHEKCLTPDLVAVSGLY